MIFRNGFNSVVFLAFALSFSPLHGQTVLMLGGASDATIGADDDVFAYLVDRYGAENVTYRAAGDVAAGEEQEFNVLLISSTINSSSARGKFHNSATPVLVWESVLTDNSVAGEFELTTRSNEVETDHTIRILSQHPITTGFEEGQEVQIVEGSQSLFWSVSPQSSGVTHLARDDDSEANGFLTIIDQGGILMGGGTAAGRRVVFGLKDTTFEDLTADGRKLFGQAVDWAAAGSVPPSPPSVENVAASEIGSSSARLGGQVTETGGLFPETTVYWGNNDGGTDPAAWDEMISFGAQGADFGGEVSGLSSETTYYFRSFVTHPGGDAWAPATSSFTTIATADPPTVEGLPATTISTTGADLHGRVVTTGGEEPEVTIYFGTTDGGTDANDWEDSVVLGTQAGAFQNSLFALQPDTTYYYRPYAENEGGGRWAAASESFRTLGYQAPTVTALPVGAVSATIMEVRGQVVSTGGEAPVIVLFYGTTNGGEDPAAWEGQLDLGEQTGEFTGVLTGLEPETRYFVKILAQNSAGSTWGGTVALETAEGSVFVINEFMASNDGGATNNINRWYPIRDQVPGTTDDWIEIANIGGAELDLAAWHLTDNLADRRQWTFPPNTHIEAGGFLLVYASGRGAPDANGNRHTSFRLSGGGDYLALIRPNGTVASEFGQSGRDFPKQDADISYGLHPATGDPVYFDRPSPGAANSSAGAARVADTKFSPDRGYYDAPLSVTITTETPDAEIYYTTDGTPPLSERGSPLGSARRYVAPVSVRGTTVLRAAARKSGLSPSNADTHTYLLLDIDGANTRGLDPGRLNNAFIQQRQPAGWGSLTAGDYNMDTRVSSSTTRSADHGNLSVAQAMLKGLRDIPTLSIGLNRNDWAGGNGIYTNSNSRGFAYERLCSAEFIPGEGDLRSDWGENCGIRVQGGASRNPSRSPKHSLSLRFRNEYGVGRLRKDLFPDGPVKDFNVISLRAIYNNSWIHSTSDQRQRASMIRDQWARETMVDMGHPDGGRGFYVHVFINGLYWGVHNMCERQDAAHYASYHGGDPDLLDARNGSEFIDGNSTAWNAMRQVVSSRNWERIQQVLDVDSYIDYQIVNRFGGNGDLKTNGNWRSAGGGPFPSGRPEEMAPWVLYSWDAERILEDSGTTSEPLDPMGIRGSMDGITEYRVRFADRLQKHFFHGGALSPTACKDRWMKFANSIDRAVIAESARWGDHRRSNAAYTRNSEWLTEQRRLCNSYFPVRSNNVLQRYRSQGFYPSIDPPTFFNSNRPQHGGELGGPGRLRMTASRGTIYYTLDGSDPRLSGGRLNPEARSLPSGQTADLTSSGLVRARARNGSTWSALVEATFYLEKLAGPDDLQITEVNYHPAEANLLERLAASSLNPVHDVSNRDLFEFFEILNGSQVSVNLDGVQFVDGVEGQIGNYVLSSGARAVVVRDPVAFALRYPNVPIAGSYTGNLANAGERLRLQVVGGDMADEIHFNDAGDWPGRADGLGSSLERIDLSLPSNSASSWRASSEYNGTPGSAGQGPDGRVVINEVLSHSDPPLVDRIEFYNPGGEDVSLAGWVLSDSPEQYRSYRFGTGVNLRAGEYLFLDESDFNAPQERLITGYAGTEATMPTVVTSAGHGLQTGEVVTISGYGGIGNYNQTFEVIVQDADSFVVETVFLDDHSTKGSWTPGRPFALSGDRGDALWLLETDENGVPVRFVDAVRFDAARSGESLVRWPDGAGYPELLSAVSNSFGEGNTAPQIGPVVISEVMYWPQSADSDALEFVEVCNLGTETENLANWRLRGGADFDFTSVHELAPGEILVMVSFDPTTVEAATFRSHYGIDASVTLVGPFTDGPLGNEAGAVRLQRPDESPPGEPNVFPAVTEDELRYESAAPWPVEAAGGGSSLHRVGPSPGFGRFAASWQAGPATPGSRPQEGLTYESWRIAQFGGDAGLTDPLDDFEGDGYANLLEFALGWNPRERDGSLRPVVEDGMLSLTFPRDPNTSGLSVRVEVSQDLVSWTTVPDEVAGMDGDLEVRRASVAIGETADLFLRIVAEQ